MENKEPYDKKIIADMLKTEEGRGQIREALKNPDTTIMPSDQIAYFYKGYQKSIKSLRDQIDYYNKAIALLQNSCPHEETEVVLNVGVPGRGGNSDNCKFCHKLIKWHDDLSSGILTTTNQKWTYLVI